MLLALASFAAIGPAKADPLYCQPNEGNTFTLQSGGTFSIDSDCGSSSLVTQPSHGTLTSNGYQSWTYTATGGYLGTDTFTVSVSSSYGNAGGQGNFGGGGGNETITLNVVPNPPTASNASASTNYNTATNVDLTSHISSQTTPTVNVTSGPSHGTATVSGEVVTYTPSSSFYGGTDTFTYTASNSGGTSNTATVSITVGPPPAPTTSSASANTAYNTATAINLSGNITGADITAVTVTSGPAHGSTSVSGETVTYTPSPNFYGGTDTFTYTATNPGGTSSASTVTVQVGPPPAPTTSAVSASTNYNTAKAIDLTSSISGADITSVNIASAPAHGTAAVNGKIVTYTPSSTYYGGTDTFTYTATNPGGTSSPSTVTVTVGAPAAPVAGNKATGTPFNTATTITLGDVITGTDVTSIAIATAPAHGTATVSGTSVTYTPATNFNGTDSFTYTATNPGGTSAPGTVTVAVAAPGVPAAAAASVSTAYNTAATLDLTNSISGTNVTAVTIASAPAHGTASISGKVLTYTPSASFYGGKDTLTYTATNAGGTSAPATVTVTVVPPGAPVATGLKVSTAYDTAATIDLSTGVSGLNVTGYAVATAPAHGTATLSGSIVTYTPAASFSGGTDTFAYTATNPGGTSAPAFVTVTVGHSSFVFSPVAGALPGGTVGSAYVQQISVSGGTAPYTYAVVTGSLPSGLTLAPKTGTISGTPASAESARFTVLVKDANGATSAASYTIAVTAPAIVIAPISTSVAAQGTTTVDLTANATGGPFTGAKLLSLSPPNAGTAIITLGETASISNEVVAQLVQSGHYKLKFTASPTFSGTAVATFTLSNASGTSAPAAVTFVVTPRADPSKDAEVIGLVNAQAEAAKRFAETQIFNFNDRLEALHDAGCSTNDWGLGVHDSRGLADNAHTDPLPDHDLDPLKQTAAGAGGQNAGNRSGAKDRCSTFANGSLAFWTGGFVNFGTNMLNGGNGYDYTTTGMSAGVDYRINPFLAVGAGFGYGSDDSRIGTNGTRSSGDVYDAVGYASYHPTPTTFVDALFGYGRLGFDSRRFVTDTGGFALGKRSGDQVFGSVTGGYEYKREALFLSPYLRVSASHTSLDAFTEFGAGAEDLIYGSQRINAITSFVGLRANYKFLTDWGAIVPELRLEYGHDFAGNSDVALYYADLGASQSYRLQTLGLGSDFMTLGLRTMIAMGNDKTLDIEYRTSFFQQRATPQQVRLGLDKRF